MTPLNEPELDAKFSELRDGLHSSQMSCVSASGKHQRMEGAVVPVEFPGALSRTVDEYVGPNGAGYLLAVEYIRDGEIWRRVFQYGPETEREHGWRNVTPFKQKVEAR